MNTSIYLHNGRLIDLMNIDKYDFTMADFCHPLALLNRYTGHTKAPYSVAEHSVLGSRIVGVIQNKIDRAFLIHDLNEALMNDLSSPFKRLMPEYCEFEIKVQKHLFRVFDEPWANMEAVSYYDKNMCQDEMMQVFKTPIDIGREPQGITVRFWSWTEARDHMMLRAKELDLA